ncbi:MAG TPA: OmpH family outer membrane protein [Oligoflexia bacterium]|nr:OmpH family outer membrane protein [Oligoflexia bacterium]HMP27119.1 OmpH family outer membrane protein [Oligoflexia bacterium]
MNIYKKYIIFALSFLFFPHSLIFAGEKDAIYVVDMQQLIDKSEMGKKATVILEKEKSQKMAQLENLKMELQKIAEEYAKQEAFLSDEARIAKRETVLKKQREFQTKQQDVMREIDGIFRREVGTIIKRAEDILKQISKERALKVVIEKDPRLVIYVSPEYDLTYDILKKLDAT